MSVAWLKKIAIGVTTALVALSFSGCKLLSKEAEKPLPAIKDPGAARVVWSSNLARGGVGFAPVLVNGQLFAAAQDGSVTRIEASTGKLVYRINTGQRLIAGVGSDGDSAVVVTRSGDVIALDGKGAVRWSLPMRLDTNTPPAVGSGLVVLRAADNRVIALDLATGKLRWNFQRNAPALVLRQASGVAISTSTVVVGLAGGRLVGLAVSDGSVRWEAPVAQAKGSNDIERLSDVVGTPLIFGREVCAVAVNGNLLCLDSNNGQILWSRALSSFSGLDIDARAAVVSRDDGSVVAHNRSSGEPLWTQAELKGRKLSAPIIAGTGVAVGDERGLVHILSRAEGTALSRVATDGSAIVSQPVAAGNLLVVQTTAGGLYAIELK